MVTGVGSGFDVVSIVESLMQYQSRGLERLNQQKSLYQFQQKAYTELKQKLTQFNETISDFESILNKNHYTSESSNEAVVSVATSSEDIPTGQYSLDVTQLAQAHQISSSAYSSKSDSLMISGELNIDIGAESFSLTVNESDTLETIKNSINISLNNPGVTASILKVTGAGGEDEYRLLLTSDETGVDNALSLSGDAATSLDLTNELTAAQNAEFTFNGFQVERNSNTVSDVLDGVTFNLNGQIGNADITIKSDIENEEAAITSAFQSVIDSYNEIMGMVAKNQSESSLRDSTYSLIELNLKNTMSQTFGSGSINTLLELGVKTDEALVKSNDDGTEYVVGGRLTIDMDQFSDSIKNKLDDVRAMFNHPTDGLIKGLETTISNIETKTIFNREKIIGEQTNNINDRIYREEDRLDQIRSRLMSQYSEVEKIISHYDAISDYLDQQLAAMRSSKK